MCAPTCGALLVHRTVCVRAHSPGTPSQQRLEIPYATEVRGRARGRRGAAPRARAARAVAQNRHAMSALPSRLSRLTAVGFLVLLGPQTTTAAATVEIFVHPVQGDDASPFPSFTQPDGTPLRTLYAAQKAVRVALRAQLQVRIHSPFKVLQQKDFHAVDRLPGC